MTSKLSITGLSKSFGNKVVLQNLNLEIDSGDSVVVLGSSGSGKSVLIKCIVGLLYPDSGSIKLDGKEITNLNYRERSKLMSKFGFLFQGGALFDSIPVWENIAFYMLRSGILKEKAAKELAVEKLRAVGLSSNVMDLYPAELSGGMQKRVALARAISNNPEVIFFDEPTTGLDPIMSNVINELIIKIKQDTGATTIAITHDIESTKKIATKIAMLYNGEITCVVDRKKLEKSNNPILDQFLKGSTKGPIALDIK